MKISEIMLLEDGRTKELKLDYTQIKKVLYSNCINAVMAARQKKIMFKGLGGLSDNSIFITDPKKLTRKSANTKNYYTLLLDNLPNWKKYPKRSQSLICSTSRYIAGGYGDNTYLVMPFNGAKIGVCPSIDIWLSFDSDGINNLKLFNGIFEYCKIRDNNYHDFLHDVLFKKNDLAEEFSRFFTSEKLQIIKNAHTIKDLILAFNNILDPNLNNFSVGTILSIPTLYKGNLYGYEVWTDSKSLLIDVKSQIYNDIIEGHI